MSPDSKLSLLCRLVDNLPEPETTKTKERGLLISLSQVRCFTHWILSHSLFPYIYIEFFLSQILKVIQTWIRELDKVNYSILFLLILIDKLQNKIFQAVIYLFYRRLKVRRNVMVSRCCIMRSTAVWLR
jgi:hypothetical protein